MSRSISIFNRSKCLGKREKRVHFSEGDWGRERVGERQRERERGGGGGENATTGMTQGMKRHS